MFGKRETEKKVDTLKDIQAIIEFLQEIKDDAKPLLKDLQKLEELEREREVANEEVLLVNLETQAEVLEKILQRYEFLQDDADINGIRIKQVARELLHRAKRAGLNELVEEKKQDMKWQFDWQIISLPEFYLFYDRIHGYDDQTYPQLDRTFFYSPTGIVQTLYLLSFLMLVLDLGIFKPFDMDS